MSSTSPRPAPDAEAQAIAELYASCYGELVAYLRRLCADHGQAEDLAQEAGMRLIAQARRETIAKPRAFLFHVATNLARDQLRRRMVSDTYAGDGDYEDGGHAPGADHIATVQEDVARVSAALNTLTPRARDVLVLARIHGHTQKEIADRLNLQPKTVENHLTRALAQLGAALSGRRRQ
ncbi:RNA polymerase sigma factor [Tahibacter caeni]|uniref:RNA polymerase sigma factor n=1 Tax=Tahibacter caeni TaxID=1453545 RepID=UPI00214730ED|nr:sigma-70 family RNA polymerase sigma factor [Tahibacter caeni]